MRATTFHGVGDIRVEDVPDSQILAPTDVIVRVTKAGICGSVCAKCGQSRGNSNRWCSPPPEGIAGRRPISLWDTAERRCRVRCPLS